MRFTNTANLPSPLVAAITHDDYDGYKYDITASGLVTPPRIRQLMKRHADEITEDVSERIWSMIGQIGHLILERAPADNIFREARLESEMLGWRIGGKVDLLRTHFVEANRSSVADEYAIDDFKLTSTWAVKDEKPEWTMQLNTYAWLARQHGFDIKQLRIVAILRDWSKPRAAREPDYPQVGVVIREVPLWPPPICEANILNAVSAHQRAEKLSDDDLPICTPEERWERPTVYAIKKKGNKRATKVLETYEEAAAMIPSFGASAFEVETRPGMSVRCVQYCAVRSFCSFGRALNDAGVIDP